VNTLPRKLWKGWETSQIGRQNIHTVKYADDLVLLAGNEPVLQGTIDKANGKWKMLCSGKERGEKLG